MTAMTHMRPHVVLVIQTPCSLCVHVKVAWRAWPQAYEQARQADDLARYLNVVGGKRYIPRYAQVVESSGRVADGAHYAEFAPCAPCGLLCGHQARFSLLRTWQMMGALLATAGAAPPGEQPGSTRLMWMTLESTPRQVGAPCSRYQTVQTLHTARLGSTYVCAHFAGTGGSKSSSAPETYPHAAARVITRSLTHSRPQLLAGRSRPHSATLHIRPDYGRGCVCVPFAVISVRGKSMDARTFVPRLWPRLPGAPADVLGTRPHGNPH